MPGLGIDEDLVRALDVVGIIAFAISGGLLAVRRGFDIVGVIALCTVTALGGGTIRDVLIGDVPPESLTKPEYLIVPIITGAALMVLHLIITGAIWRAVLVFDAVGLALFCVTGTLKALAYDIVPVGAVGLGVVTATGGGVLRDVLAGEPPQMFRADSVLYSIPAAAGATALVVLVEVEQYQDWMGILIAVGVFALRGAAMRFDWHAWRPSTSLPLPRPKPPGDDR